MAIYIINSIVTGILFYTAFQFLIIGVNKRKSPLFLIFGLIVLFQSCCALYELYGLMSESKDTYVLYRRSYYILTAIINVLFYYFVFFISGYNNRYLKVIYYSVIIITLLVNFTIPLEAIIKTSNEFIHFKIAWGFAITWFYTVLFILQFALLSWYCISAFYHMKSNKNANAKFIIISIILFLPGSFNDLAIDFGLVHYPISSYLYLALIIYMNINLIDYLGKAEKFELEASKGEILLNEVFNNAPVAMILLNVEADIVRINNQGKKIGLSTDDLNSNHQPGNILGCLIAYKNDNQGCGNGKECIRCDLRNSIKSTLLNKSGVAKIPYRMQFKNNEQKDLLISTSFIEAYGSSMVLLILEDITSNLKAKEALIESEFRYRQIAKAITDYIYTVIVNGNGDIQTIHTRACLYITGYLPEEFEANQKLWFEIIVEEDRQKVIDFIKNITAVSGKQSIDYRIINKNGEIRWVLNILVLKKWKPNFAMFDGVIRDITHRKETEQELRISEEKFHNIFNTSSDGIIITDFESRVLEINQISLDRSGLTYEQMIGKQLFELFPSIPKEEASYHLRNIPELKKAVFQTNYVNTRGEKVYIEIVGHLIHYNGKEAALLISRDITERIISQQKILNAIIGAEEKERRLFSQELHDGIGPILSTIKLYMQWIQNPGAKSNKEDLLKDALDTIEEAITSVKEISNRLSPNVLNKFGLSTALQSYVKKIECLGAIRFSLDINIPERLRPEIESMLYRVSVEAINNSIKYSNASELSLIISTNKNGLTMIVRDNGSGFDIEKVVLQKKGNGLFNMQNRVETYEGMFSISSKPGSGTEIIITLPLN